MKTITHLVVLCILTLLTCISCTTEELDQIQNEKNSTIEQKRLRPITTPTLSIPNNGGCGTTIDNSTPAWINDDYSEYTNSFSVLPPINIKVKYHIVRTDFGEDGIPLADLDVMTTQLNDDFMQPQYGCIEFNHSPSRIRFIHDGDVNYIDQTSYHIIDTNTSDTSLIAPEYDALIMEGNNPDKINIYVIKGFNTFSNIQLYSKAAMNGNTVVVVRDQDAHISPHLTHGVGHNLGLYHTWHRNSICDLKTRPCDGTIGDFIEDTPIVSSISNFSINENCEYYRWIAQSCNGTSIRIPKENAIFNSKNIMAGKSLNSDCREGFTGMQHVRMNQQTIERGLGSEE